MYLRISTLLKYFNKTFTKRLTVTNVQMQYTLYLKLTDCNTAACLLKKSCTVNKIQTNEGITIYFKKVHILN